MIKDLYLAAFQVSSLTDPRIVITVTRCLDGVGCESPNFLQLWHDSPCELREMFKYFVWSVAMDVINNNFLHWDIRPANIIYQFRYVSSTAGISAGTDARLSIIDWESGLNPFSPIEVVNSTQFSTLLNGSKSNKIFQNEKCDYKVICFALVCERLIDTCLLRYVNDWFLVSFYLIYFPWFINRCFSWNESSLENEICQILENNIRNLFNDTLRSLLSTPLADTQSVLNQLFDSIFHSVDLTVFELPFILRSANSNRFCSLILSTNPVLSIIIALFI